MSEEITNTLIPDEIIVKPEKDPNITYIKRTVIIKDELEEVEKQVISEIKRTKVSKIGTFGIKKRMEIPKFGQCAKQSRGTVEPGIVRVDNEYKIVNRKLAVHQETLKDKFKTSTQEFTKENLMEKMLLDKERERKLLLEKTAHHSYYFRDNRTRRKYESKETDIKITGFDMRLNELDLMKIFDKIGTVKRCCIVRDKKDRNIKRNIAYLEFENTIHVDEAIEYYNNRTIGNSVFIVCRPEDDIY